MLVEPVAKRCDCGTTARGRSSEGLPRPYVGVGGDVYGMCLAIGSPKSSALHTIRAETTQIVSRLRRRMTYAPRTTRQNATFAHRVEIRSASVAPTASWSSLVALDLVARKTNQKSAVA